MLKRITSLLLLTLCTLTVNFAHARPYHGDIFTFYQPDGQEFQVRLFGDEYYVVIESLDAYTLTKDIKTGFYCYAQPAPDGMSFISTGIKAGEPLPPSMKLEKNSRLSRSAIQQKSDAARKKFGVDSKGKLLPANQLRLRPQDFGYEQWTSDLEQEAQSLEALPMSSTQPGPPSDTTTGTRVGLLLLAQFPDRPGDVTISQSQVDAYANDPAYTTFGNATSVYGYFNIQSNGKLQYNCIVSSYFAAAQNRDYYTDNTVAYGTRARELINEGLAVLKADGFDFTKADANNDAILDGVNLFYAGYSQNNWAEGLWPHKSSSSWDGLSGEGVSSNFQYQITYIGGSLSLGTFCHENGHMLCNFPDLYAYNGNAAKISYFSLMSNSGNTHPVSIDAYLKIHAGWSTVIELTSGSHLRGAVEVDKNTFYRYNNPVDSNEYFLLSVRTDSGYEGIYGGSGYDVNPTDGLVIWHAYEDGSNTYSSIFTEDSGTADIDYTLPYELMVVEANPSSTTTPWYDNPTPGSNDAYHSEDVNEVSDLTTPALKFWNIRSGRTTASSMHIHSVSGQGDMVTFTVGTGTVTDSPTIGMTSSTLDPSCDLGTDCASQTFAIFNSGGNSLIYTVSDNVFWLSISPSSGSATTEADQVTVSYNTDTLSPGTYNGTITVTGMEGTTNSPQTIPVSLTIHPQPVINLTPLTLSKTLLSGVQGTESFTLSNSGGGTLSYSLSEFSPWLQLASSSGTINAEEDEITAVFDASDLSAARYLSTITIDSDSASNSPQTIDVSLTVINISIMNPNGGETLWQGNKHDIRWLTDGYISGNVQIDLYKNGSRDRTLTASTANDGFYRWTIPADLAIGNDYTIRITSINEPLLHGESNSSFSIAAMPGLLSIPYSESFESGFGGWSQSSADDYDWWRYTGSTDSSSTGPSYASDGTYYIYTEASTPNYPEKTMILEAYFDLRSSTAPLMSFDYHMYGEAMGELEVRASSDQTHWTTLFSKSGNQYDNWYGHITDLSSLSGKVIVIQIVGITGSSFTSDMALDDLSIAEATKALSYSYDTFTESSNDDGSMANSRIITLTGDTFTATAVSDGYITVSNIPDGLTARFVPNSSTQITFSLTGNASSHEKTDSIQDLIVQFAGGAFTSRIASSVANSTKTMNVNFIGLKIPDLVVVSPGVSDNTLEPGQSYEISATAKNQGTATANPTTMYYYLSDDATINTSDSQLTTDFVSQLTAGATSPEQAWVTAPSTIGTYWVGACVATVADESNTTNQCSSGIQITTTQPDLVATSPSVSHSNLTPGQLYDIFAAAENQGTATADSTRMRYYLSDDTTINPSDDSYLTSRFVNSLEIGATALVTGSTTAPTSAGTYWVGACVDEVADESNTNNQCSAGVPITIIQPDLVVHSISVSHSDLRSNQSYTILATAENQGTATAESTTIRYYLSDNATINTSDTQLTTSPINSLTTGATSTDGVPVTAPATGGSYWVGACIDVVADESNNTNQCSTGIAIEVNDFCWPLFLPAIIGATPQDSL